MDKIKQAYNSDSGKIIKNNLENVVEMLNDVETIDGENFEMIAVETVARQRAISLLRELLFLTEEQPEKKKADKDNLKKYGY